MPRVEYATALVSSLRVWSSARARWAWLTVSDWEVDMNSESLIHFFGDCVVLCKLVFARMRVRRVGCMDWDRGKITRAWCMEHCLENWAGRVRKCRGRSGFDSPRPRMMEPTAHFFLLACAEWAHEMRLEGGYRVPPPFFSDWSDIIRTG